MKLTNDSYLILVRTSTFTERYYRHKPGWLKVSARPKIRKTERDLTIFCPRLPALNQT